VRCSVCGNDDGESYFLAIAGWTVTKVSEKAGRKYITPEDVSDALKEWPVGRVRADVLAVIAKQTEYGCEDAGLCAFIAWRSR